jgi:hypothetical protein
MNIDQSITDSGKAISNFAATINNHNGLASPLLDKCVNLLTEKCLNLIEEKELANIKQKVSILNNHTINKVEHASRIGLIVTAIIIAVSAFFKWSLKKLGISLVVEMGLALLASIEVKSRHLEVEKHNTVNSIFDNLEKIKNILNINQDNYEVKDWNNINLYWEKITNLLKETNNLTFRNHTNRNEVRFLSIDLRLINQVFRYTIETNITRIKLKKEENNELKLHLLEENQEFYQGLMEYFE